MADEAVVEAQNTEVVNNPFGEDEGGVITLPTDLVDGEQDPAIAGKDEKIKEEKPISDAPNQPEKIPTASPKDIPARTEEEKTDIIPATELKFANKTSENIYNLLKEGKEEDVYNYLSEKRTLANVEKMPAADLIKLQIQNENKDYSPEEVNDVFEEKYVIPDAPEQSLDETDDEFERRTEKFEKTKGVIERRIEREAKSAKAELLKLSEELVLPDTQQPKQNEPTQEELDNATKARENYLNSIDDGLKDFNSINATYKDKDVEIQAEYKLSADEKTELKSDLENFNIEEFVQERWLSKDGNVNTAQLAKDMFQMKYGDKAVQKLINEVGSKRHAAAIKGIRNVDFNGNHTGGSTNVAANEVEDKMAEFFMTQN